ncbi:MAG: hypothetical protein IJ350_07045 [Clostridia bacterium]|nr:hypothetical protein [Clostridia bacterium]
MSEEFDMDELMDEMAARIEDAVESAVEDQVADAVVNAVQDTLPEVMGECFADFEFMLPNGTIVRPRQYMKLLSPDKTKLLLCYGGLKVDGTTLLVQTRVSSWEAIAVYPSQDEAVEALLTVKSAMDAHQDMLEL